jgi:hypothetical protein
MDVSEEIKKVYIRHHQGNSKSVAGSGDLPDKSTG